MPKPRWGEKIKWEDITVPFNRQALRVRVYFSDAEGRDQLLGKVLVDIRAIEQDLAKDARGFVDGWYELEMNELTAAPPTPEKKPAWVLQADDFTPRRDEDVVESSGSCFLELKLRVLRAEYEKQPKIKGRAWRVAQEKLVNGTVDAHDITELAVLQTWDSKVKDPA